MATSVVDAESVLAIDLGSLNTRALLFDVVEGQYHFIAAGVAPSTFNAPYADVNEGVFMAAKQIEEITGRAIYQDGRLVLPTQSNGAGVDRLVVTFSGGPVVRVVVAGLLPDVSLESAQRLATSTYGKVLEVIGLTDHRRSEVQLDAILQVEPELLILAGGTENGATRSVSKLVEMLALICRVLPPDRRPEVLYAGNQVLAKRTREYLGRLTTVHLAPNVRPSIDQEDLGPAQDALARAVGQIRTRQMGGLAVLSSVCATPPIPTAQAFGRLVRFLAQLNDPLKGVLGVDLGASSTVLAASVGSRVALSVLDAGMGMGVKTILEQCTPDDILQWMTVHSTPEAVKEFLWNKMLYPASLPMTVETMSMERALGRVVLRMAAQQLSVRWPELNMSFEPILAGGMTLTRAQSPGQALLMLLDGLQPLGVTTVLLDQNGLLPSLGAIASINTLLPVQIFETNALLNLGTVVCPVSEAKYGTVILRGRLAYETGNETQFEVKQGSLMVLPLRAGQTARLYLTPQHGTRIDPALVQAQGFKIIGGVCGAVIDARGRPLVLPPEPSRRREMLKKWAMALNG